MNDIRERRDIPREDRWDLEALYPSEADWERDFQNYKDLYPKVSDWKGRLGESAAVLREFLDFTNTLELLSEKLGEYAHLRVAENVAEAEANERMGRLMNAYTQSRSLSSFFVPEIQAIAPERMASFLEDETLADFRISLNRILRYRAYVLSEESERILALGTESSTAVQKTFSNLLNADLNFGTLETAEGPKPLTQSTFALFLQNQDRGLRLKAFDQFYAEFKAHENTLAALYAGSIQQDIYKARARGFSTSRFMALFPDDVPETVYDNLVGTVTDSLGVLHRYYEIRRKALKLDKLHHSDVYAPLLQDVVLRHTYDQAVSVVIDAIEPLGVEYSRTLKKGLLGGWVDKYENKGKRSGAFSAGTYTSYPYILLNFKEDNLRDVFTLAHEAGHSMHSWYSVRNNPFQHYGYTIFEAEVASTFNEQLLGRHLLQKSSNTAEKSYILVKLIEDTVATLFRQTMFAEFEHQVHAYAENGGGLTLEYFKKTYRVLLEKYFGPQVQLEENSALEGLRIPHFYHAFYVYKYATGLSAAMALSRRVLTGGVKEREEYLNFLKSGGSTFPLESLKKAGVDMSRPEPVKQAIEVFSGMLDEWEKSQKE